jgi:hypothetical protein
LLLNILPFTNLLSRGARWQKLRLLGGDSETIRALGPPDPAIALPAKDLKASGEAMGADNATSDAGASSTNFTSIRGWHAGDLAGGKSQNVTPPGPNRPPGGAYS